MKKAAIGFIGVGRMGANMARRLKDLDYPIAAVFDHYEASAVELVSELGSFAAKSLAEVTEKSDVIFTVVSDDSAMLEIFSGENSLLQRAEGKVFINCATVSPKTHEQVAQLALVAGAKTLAASMASSIMQARQGSLYLMVGGDEATFKENETLLKNISSSLRYVGSVGNAAKIKALVNMVMNINTAGLAESLGLGAALGIDLQILKEIFAQTGANSRVLETDGDDMIFREHDCYFSAVHAAKDSGIANSLAKQVGVTTPLSLAAQAQYQKMINLGLGELDKSGIAELTFPYRANI
jgi:3-hydroxyisobutyrate dehydrogenase